MAEFNFDSVFKELMQACNLDTVVILDILTQMAMLPDQ